MNQQLISNWWLTRADRSVLLQHQEDLIFLNQTSDLKSDLNQPQIDIDLNQIYQTIEGFGFCLTGGSAYLLNQLSDIIRYNLLIEIFGSNDNSIGVSYLRISIGASDLGQVAFSYSDLPINQINLDLNYFNLNAGDHELIPILREIVAINPELKIIASPWSAPPWMKTNKSFIGGKLEPQYYAVYADYLVKYIQTMQQQSIKIHAITVQNEPMNPNNEPSMVMESSEQIIFIKNYLGPALHYNNLSDIEIFCWDHNCDLIEYPLTVLADATVRSYLSGVAWHLYGGEVGALSAVHKIYPEMKMVFTEQWVGINGNFADDLIWHIKNVIIGTLCNWAQFVLEWNLAGDLNCGPHTPHGASSCVGAFTIDVANNHIIRNVSYYVIAHVAKFVKPGAQRIFSSVIDNLPNVAFQTIDNKIVLIVLNENENCQNFTIKFNQKLISAQLDGRAVASYIWQIV